MSGTEKDFLASMYPKSVPDTSFARTKSVPDTSFARTKSVPDTSFARRFGPPAHRLDWWRGKCCSRHLGARLLPSFRCLSLRLSAGDSMGNLANCRENTRCTARSLVSGVNHSHRSRPATAGWNRHESASKLSAPTAIQGGDALANERPSELSDALADRT